MAENTRLYDLFQPDHYDVYLDINRAKKTIAGTTTINGHASQPVIKLNQKYLHITAVTVDQQPVPFTVKDDEEAVEITLPAAGDVKLSVDEHPGETIIANMPENHEENGVH